MIKALILPHGNKDHYKEDLKTDSVTCSPFGIRIIQLIAVTKSGLWRKWTSIQPF